MQVSPLSSNFESNGVTSHDHGLAAKYSFKLAASEVASFEKNFFGVVGPSETETSLSGKAEYLLARGEDKNVSFLD